MSGGGSYTGDLDRWMKEGSIGGEGATLCEEFHQGDLGEASFTEEL